MIEIKRETERERERERERESKRKMQRYCGKEKESEDGWLIGCTLWPCRLFNAKYSFYIFI